MTSRRDFFNSPSRDLSEMYGGGSMEEPAGPKKPYGPLQYKHPDHGRGKQIGRKDMIYGDQGAPGYPHDVATDDMGRSEMMDCPDCEGAGKIVCPSCEGLGSLHPGGY